LITLAVAGISVVVFGNSIVETVFIGAGVLFLVYMGSTTWSSDQNLQDDRSGFSVKKQVSFAASVSLLNPHAILDTIGVIGTNSLHYTGVEKWMFTFTCIFVSWICFFLLALSGMTLQRINPSGRWMHLLNKASACLIWGIALYMAASLVNEFR
jgi:L-lysine exporter family protein LysE/ArgO